MACLGKLCAPGRKLGYFTASVFGFVVKYRHKHPRSSSRNTFTIEFLKCFVRQFLGFDVGPESEDFVHELAMRPFSGFSKDSLKFGEITLRIRY